MARVLLDSGEQDRNQGAAMGTVHGLFFYITCKGEKESKTRNLTRLPGGIFEFRNSQA